MDSKDSLEEFVEVAIRPKFEKYIQKEDMTELLLYFKYPYQIRQIIYTTNPVEGFNRQIRKITKSKGIMPNDTAQPNLGNEE